MKYLRKFNESDECYDNAGRANVIKGDIKDMSLDIQDEGFRVVAEDDKDPYYPSFGYAPDLNITIDKFDRGYRDSFSLDEIRDFLLRLIKYDRTNPCSIEIFIPKEHHNNQLIRIDYSERLGFTHWDKYNPFPIKHRVSYVFIKIRIFK